MSRHHGHTVIVLDQLIWCEDCGTGTQGEDSDMRNAQKQAVIRFTQNLGDTLYLSLFDEVEDSLCDLLADMYHIMDECGIDRAELEERAYAHYAAEREGNL